MNDTSPKLISLVIPLLNEQENIPIIHAELVQVIEALEPAYGFEIIFVNDGSTDGSQAELEKLASKSTRVKFLEFSRNFGKEEATSAGLLHSRGHAVIMLDADLQHPVDLIPEFLEKWNNGADIVIGIRKANNGEGPVKKLGSKLFYKIIGAISETEITPNATDLRLLDRRVVTEFNNFSEHGRITRGLVDWLGFKRDYIEFTANARRAGKASYGTIKLFKLALDGFISHSLFPLKLAGYIGAAITVTSFPLGIFIIFEKYVFHDPWNMNFSGPAVLGVLTLFLVGIILSCLGLIALYIGNIHVEVAARPLYVVRNKKL